MPKLIKPNDVKIITKDGELKVLITLDLNINLTNLLEGVSLPQQNEKKDSKTDLDEKVTWAIPDFSSEKIDFGK
jgi:hypothetical protein